MSKKKIIVKILDTIFFIMLIIIICKIYGIYKIYNFNGFTKAEVERGTTNFLRDKEIKYSYDYSYKIESKNYNDAMFYKEIAVKPNTPYKLSCMVKTENIESDGEEAGAQISILDTTESSEVLTGTREWQELNFIFDSRNREKIKIGFRLGGNEAKSKGTVWFSDFKLEEGLKDNSTNWNMACFVIKHIDVKLNNQELKLTMSANDIETIKNNMERFKNTAKELSNNKMTVEYDIYEINTPVTSVTYSEEFRILFKSE